MNNLTGSQISKLGEFYAECIRENSIETNCLMGIDHRDTPLVIAASMTLFNRYGIDCAYRVDDDIENAAFDSRAITLITDTFTSGCSLFRTLEKIKSRVNKYPSDVVVCVDRMERSEISILSARHKLEKIYGIKIHPIVTADDIVRALESGAVTAGETYEKLQEYLQRYKGE